MVSRKTPAPKPDDPEQHRRFVDMAREVEADESPEAMDRAFGKIIRGPSDRPGEGELKNRRRFPTSPKAQSSSRE